MGKNREKRLLKTGTIFLLWLLFLTASIRAQEPSVLEKARTALREGKYQTVINICRGYLEANPDDLDITFILAQAEAFSGNHDEALRLCNLVLDRAPNYHDALILKSRLSFWKNDPVGARKLLENLLEGQPENLEAQLELARIDEAQHNYLEAREIYEKLLDKKLPDWERAEICWRLGRISLNMGQNDKARELFIMAAELEPANEEYRRALNSLEEIKTRNNRSIFQNRKEIWLQHRVDDYSDQPKTFHADRLFFLFQPLPSLTLIPKLGVARYYAETDCLFGLEAYPKLWKKAYAYLDFNLAEPGHSFARTSYLFEIYQSFKNIELSLGYWRMNFSTENVSVYLGSLGYYYRAYYFFLKAYYTPLETGRDFSWVAQARRYFGQENYLYLSVGSGSRPFEINNIGDLAFVRSTTAGAGFKAYIRHFLLLEGHFSWLKEKSGPTRTSLTLTAGYRF